MTMTTINPEVRLTLDKFEKELDKIEKNVRIMVIWELGKSGQIIKEHTYLLVPFDQGFLAEGFYQQSKSKTGSYYSLEVGFSAAKNPFTSYDYAWIQEMLPFNHAKRGTQFFLGKGMAGSEKEIWDNIESNFYRVLASGEYW